MDWDEGVVHRLGVQPLAHARGSDQQKPSPRAGNATYNREPVSQNRDWFPAIAAKNEKVEGVSHGLVRRCKKGRLQSKRAERPSSRRASALSCGHPPAKAGGAPSTAAARRFSERGESARWNRNRCVQDMTRSACAAKSARNASHQSRDREGAVHRLGA